MSLLREAEEVRLAATHLNKEADNLEKRGQGSLSPTILELRIKALENIQMAEKMEKRYHIELETEAMFEHLTSKALQLAKELNYRVDTLLYLRETGVLQELANDWNILIETLEIHVIRVIEDQIDIAIEHEILKVKKRVTIDLPVWNRSDNELVRRIVKSGIPLIPNEVSRNLSEANIKHLMCDLLPDVKPKKRAEIRDRVLRVKIAVGKMAVAGLSGKAMADRAGLTTNQVDGIIQRLPSADRLQRKIAIKAKSKKRIDLAIELKNQGLRTCDVSSRVGLSPQYVDAVTKGEKDTNL